MGRYNLAPQRVHQNMTLLIDASRQAAQRKAPAADVHIPPWFDVIGANPPPERLVRPAMQRPQKPGKKASKLFNPVRISYQEDKLRWEYFNDHPWELARPRIVLEDHGKDGQKWDWSVPLDHGLLQPLESATDDFGNGLLAEWRKIRKTQCKRPINGEAVVQRQAYLMRNGMTEEAAYDKARKEYYRVQHYRETELRVAREEALATGAVFSLGPVEKGALLEDQQYKTWKDWAGLQVAQKRAVRGAAYTGTVEPEESAVEEGSDDLEGAGLDEPTESLAKPGPDSLPEAPARSESTASPF